MKIYKTRLRKLSYLVVLLFLLAIISQNFLMAFTADIHSSNTDKSSSTMSADTTRDGYKYSGKYTNNNKVTMFDYVSDYELQHGYNNCSQFEEGYVDAFTTFNGEISNTGLSNNDSSENITFIYNPCRKGITDVSIHIFDDSGHNNGWPGYSMEYDSSIGKYVLTMKYNDLYSALSNNTPKHFIINGHDEMSTNNKRFETETINTGAMEAGKSYTYSDYTENVGTANQITFTLPKSIARALKVEGSVSTDKNYLEDGDWSGKDYPVKVNIWDDSSHNNSSNRPSMTYYSSGDYWQYVLSSSVLSSYNSELYVTFKSIKYYNKNNNSYYLSSEQDYGNKAAETDEFKVRKGYNYTFNVSCTVGTANNTYSCAYTNPLYFGDFWLSNDASGYTGSNTPSYNNFYWQANMGMKAITGRSLEYSGSSVMQGLVNSNLYGGSRG